MKRNRHGLLLQGSAERKAVRADFDWDLFADRLTRLLAQSFAGNGLVRRSGFEIPEDTGKQLIERFTGEVWNRKR